MKKINKDNKDQETIKSKITIFHKNEMNVDRLPHLILRFGMRNMIKIKCILKSTL